MKQFVNAEIRTEIRKINCVNGYNYKVIITRGNYRDDIYAETYEDAVVISDYYLNGGVVCRGTV